MYGELGRMPLQHYRYLYIIKYWIKLLGYTDHKYTKKVYLMLKSDVDTHPNVKNWCSLLRDLLSSLGLYDVWLYHDIGNCNHAFLSSVKQRIQNQFYNTGMKE